VHDVAVAFDDEALAQLHAARFGDAPDIVAAQVDQHEVLGALLGVGQQFGFQCGIGFGRGAARTGAGDRAHGDGAVLQPGKNLR